MFLEGETPSDPQQQQLSVVSKHGLEEEEKRPGQHEAEEKRPGQHEAEEKRPG